MPGVIGKARVLTAAELKRTLTVARSGRHGARNFALMQCSYRLGLRAKEMAGLRVEDVLAPDGQIREDLLLPANIAKGKKPRTLYLTHPVVRSALTDYLTQRRSREGGLYNVRAPLFMSQQGCAFSPNTMQQLFHRMYRAAGIDGARSHSGRRWFATELISKGVDLKAVSVLMGHSSVAMTARYADDNPVRLRRIAAELL
jgi:integrase/recombinase XerD